MPTQRMDCLSAIKGRGGRKVLGHFSDEAVSAYSRSRGSGLAEALDKAASLATEGDGAELWVQHSDRLARGDGRTARHLVEVALWALQSDVVIRPVEDPDTFRDLLHAVVTGERNHEDSRRKAVSVAAGKRRAAERGEFGRVLDGYRVQVELGHRGKVTKRMEIDPERREIFDTIFRLGRAGKTPASIARTLDSRGWRTAPVNHRAPVALFTASRVRTVLGNPRYAGLAIHKGLIVGVGQWPGYIMPEAFDRLQAKRRKKARPAQYHPSEPFLLARLASCALCGGRMLAITGRGRLDGTPLRRYVCARHRDGPCPARPVNAELAEILLTANLMRFISGLATDRLLDEVPRDELPAVALTPDLTRIGELKERIGLALSRGDHQEADDLLEELIERRQQHQLSDNAGQAVRHALHARPGPTLRDTLGDFQAWSANELSGRPIDVTKETRRLNQLLRNWFSTVVLGQDHTAITVRPVARSGSATDVGDGGLDHQLLATGDLGSWKVELWKQGYQHRRHAIWTKAELMHAARSWAKTHDHSPRWTDWERASPENPSARTIRNNFGVWSQFLRASGLPDPPAQQRHQSRDPQGRLCKADAVQYST
jgi:Homing endonuclease associated repeat/Recombinase/Resolvase, N terminal domain